MTTIITALTDEDIGYIAATVITLLVFVALAAGSFNKL